jgi:hypothetical protein
MTVFTRTKLVMNWKENLYGLTVAADFQPGELIAELAWAKVGSKAWEESSGGAWVCASCQTGILPAEGANRTHSPCMDEKSEASSNLLSTAPEGFGDFELHGLEGGDDPGDDA